MKTRRILSVAVMLLGLLLRRDALAFYNPSTGKWLNRDPIEEKGGANVTGLAGNDLQNKVDVLGQDVNLPPGGSPFNPWPYAQFPQCSRCKCGPDVTHAVHATLKAIAKAFSDAAPDVQRAAAEALYTPGIAEAAWDIDYLKQIGRGGPNAVSPFEADRGQPVGNCDCRGTVVYEGNCVHAGSLNYIAWGHMNQLAHEQFTSPYYAEVPGMLGIPLYPVTWSLLDARVGTKYQKNVINKDSGETAAQALAFTTIGYQGSIPAAPNLKHCDTTGSKPIAETVLHGRWGRIRF